MMSGSKLVIKMKMPKPYTRKSIKPRQAHKLANRPQRHEKHQKDYCNEY